MDFEDIKTFLTLTKTKNFSRTAESLFVAQSTVTARIKAVERELGKDLFIRDNKHVELTPYGKLFIEYAEQIYTTFTEGKSNIMHLDRYREQFSIAAPDTIWQHFLLKSLDRSIREDNDISYRFICNHSDHIIDGVLDNDVDVGISLRKPYHPDIESIPCYEDGGFYLVGSPKLNLPAETVLTPENIHDLPFIFMEQSVSFKSWLNKYYRCYSFFLETERFFLFTELLLSGVGIGFLPARCARQHIDSGRLVNFPYQFEDLLPKEKAYILYLKKNQKRVSEVVGEISAEVSNKNQI